jgi:hypothetical protein
MPAVGEGWSDAQMNALTSFLRQRFAGRESSGG